MIRLEWLLTLHLIAGSGRWAELPPGDLGLPLMTAAAIALNVLANGPRWVGKFPRVQGVSSLSPRLGLFMAVLTLSCLWTPSPAYGVQKTIRVIALDLIPMALAVTQLRRGTMTSARICQCLRWASVVVAVIGLVPLVAPGSLPDLARLSIAHTDPIRFGTIAAVGALLWSTRISMRRPIRHQLGSIFGAAVCVLALMGSNSKGPVVAFILAELVLLCRSVIRRGPSTRLQALAVVAIVVVSLAVLPTSLTSRLDYGLYTDPSRQGASESVRLRERLWDHAIEQFKESPVVGGGAGSFNEVRESAYGEALPRGGGTVLYPHNVVLETLAELGVIGLTALSLLLVGVLDLVRKSSASRETVSLLVVGLAMAQVTGDLSDQRLLWLAVVLAIGDGYARRIPTSHEEGRREGDSRPTGTGRRRPERGKL